MHQIPKHFDCDMHSVVIINPKSYSMFAEATFELLRIKHYVLLRLVFHWGNIVDYKAVQPGAFLFARDLSASHHLF